MYGLYGFARALAPAAPLNLNNKGGQEGSLADVVKVRSMVQQLVVVVDNKRDDTESRTANSQ